MNTSISARHCEISTELRERAREALSRLATFLTRPLDGTVVFDVRAQAALAEIRMHAAQGETFVATGEDRDHRSALDRAVAKIRRQVGRDGSPGRRGRGPRGTV